MVNRFLPAGIFSKLTLKILSFLLLFPASCLLSQEDAQEPLVRWMDRIAQEQLQQRENAISLIRTVDDARRRKETVRAKLLELIGGLPDYHGPLNPRVTGSLKTESYTIEKIIFESLPGFYVTANLYRPNQPGRYPAVLLPLGHWQQGKPAMQRIAANLALKGFVAMAYDPIGQGEREQVHDRRIGGTLAGWSTNEHIQAGAQNLLINQSVARYFIWDAKRSLDYLLSRPEVDSSKVGCTGCSGGGTLTTYISALDPRVKVAAPACYINSFRLLFTGATPDNEMSLPRFLAAGLDMADFVELSAPNPWLILSTEKDFFPPEGARIVYEEARHWYGLYGAEDKVRLFVGPGPHGTPLESREVLYEWMIRWLKNGQGDSHEQPVKMFPDHELLVTRSGQVEDERGSRKLYQLTLDEYRTQKKPGTIPELVAELRKLIARTDADVPSVKISSEYKGQNGLIQKISFETEPGLEISGMLYIPEAPGRKPAVLLVAGETTAPLAEKMAKTGVIVLELEVRHSPTSYDNRPYLGDWKSNTRAGLIGRNLPAMRAFDILRGVDILAARLDVDPARIRATARDVKGIWLLLAAALDPRIKGIWLDRTPYNLRSALESPINTNLHDGVVPGFILHWDLEDLVKALGTCQVLWTDPTNWMTRVVTLGSPFRYRYMDEPDDPYIEKFLRK